MKIKLSKIINSHIFWISLWLAGMSYTLIIFAIDESGPRKYPSQMYINVKEEFICSLIIITTPIIASLRCFYSYLETKNTKFIMLLICYLGVVATIVFAELNNYFHLIRYINR